MAVAVPSVEPESILAVLEEILRQPTDVGAQYRALELGGWARVHVYLPETDIHSVITPPFMEAFLELQRQVYRLGAFAETGIADIGQLSERSKRALEIRVVVTDGSSNLTADLSKVVEGLLHTMIGKLTGKQAAIVLISFAALLAAGWAFSSWLEATKAIKIEELKSKDHIAALQALQFASAKDAAAFSKVLEILAQQGEFAERALEAVKETNEALLKAASQTPKTQINNVELLREEAELLRISPKKKPEIKYVRQRIKVVDINTSDPTDLSLILKEIDSTEEHRIKFKDDIFAGQHRKKLFDSLETRTPIWVELAIKQVDGEIRSVQLLRTLDEPTE